MTREADKRPGGRRSRRSAKRLPHRLGVVAGGAGDPMTDDYRGLFQSFPISLWEEDLSELREYIDALGESGVEDLRAYLEDHPDELQRCASMAIVVDVNEAALALLECEQKERFLGRLPIVFRQASAEDFLEEVVALARGETDFERECVQRTFRGKPLDVRVRVALAPGRENNWSKVFVSLTDISEWKRTREQLEMHRVAMESSADAIFITDRDGRIEWVNRAFEKMSGFGREEALGKTPGILKSELDDGGHYREIWATLRPGDCHRGRTVNRHKEGGLYTVDQTITPTVDESGEISHFVAVQEDISERLRSEEQLIHLARFDFLTELPNRYTFNDRLEREALRSARQGQSVAVLLLDIDHFKDINDLFGHPVGDAFLVSVARRLETGLRDLDTVARLGGDEFAVLQTDADRPESTAILAQRLISLLERPFEVEGNEIVASASIGIAIGKGDEVDPEQMIRQADMALYRAKQAGRGTFRFHSEEMDGEIQERLTISRDLRIAMERNELFVEFQPQFALTSGRMTGVEALARWRHPQRGLVPPDHFIPVAEQNGFIVPLGEWVLEAACRGFLELPGAAAGDLRLAVNVSAVEMRVPDFPVRVLDVLQRTGLEPDAVELELTESVLMQRTHQLERTMEELHDVGVRVAVDDFGTGYSSMMYLRQFWVDKLKIDRSFLERVESSRNDAAIVDAMIALGDKLEIEVLAEGVERQSQLDFLRRHGCHQAQGFLLAHPAGVDLLADRLNQGLEIPLA